MEVETHDGQGVGVHVQQRDDGLWAIGPFAVLHEQTPHERLAALAVEAVLKNLEGRNGIGNALEDVDEDVREDMTGELHSAVMNAWGNG